MAEKETKYTPPVKATQQQQKMYGDRLVVAVRPSRAGDDGYQLSTPDAQVTAIFEDGSDKVVKPEDITTAA